MTRKEYTKNIYAMLFIFKKLKHLSIVSSSINDYPPLSLYISPPITFSSSLLTKLCINVYLFEDCLALLDGRFKQLTTFIVQVKFISRRVSTSHNRVSLCFILLSLSKFYLISMIKYS